MIAADRRPWWRSRWWMPGFSLFLGVLVAGAMWIGGNEGDAVFSFLLFVALAALFAFGGRSDTISGLGGPGRDERWAMIDLRATAFAGLVVIFVLIGAWLWELAHGRDGSPYTQVCALGGIAYVLAIAVLRVRG
jgi:hypothetical protein